MVWQVGAGCSVTSLPPLGCELTSEHCLGCPAVGIKCELAMIIKQREEAAGESNQAVGQVSTQSAHGPIART